MTNLELNWNAITNLMNPDTREQVAFELAPCTIEQFLSRYLELDSDFENVLNAEISHVLED